MGASPVRQAPRRGNFATRASDTPTTHRERASCSENPHWPGGCRVAYKTGSAPVGTIKLAQHHSPSTKSAAQPGHRAREQRQGADIARQLARGLHQGTTLFAQQQPRRAPSVQNSPRTPLLTVCAVQNSPCSPEMAQFGAFCPHRESFVPLWSAQHRAGRILYRSHHQEAKQGEFCTEPEAESGLATTAHQAPLVRKAPEGAGETGGSKRPGHGVRSQ